MKDIYNVKVSRKALKTLKQVPAYIELKLYAWIDGVGHHGLSQVRQIPGYHDEPLKGKRAGQRSIRLTRSYRAIYVIHKDSTIKFVNITEVNKHEY